jgi:hypothetical protein
VAIAVEYFGSATLASTALARILMLSRLHISLSF